MSFNCRSYPAVTRRVQTCEHHSEHRTRLVSSQSHSGFAILANSSAVYNGLGIPVAAGLLYPFFGVLLSPIIAGAVMSLSSVSVIANALQLPKAMLAMLNERLP